MTFSLGSNHDQHYTCKCGQFMRGQQPLTHTINWACGTCHEQLIIFMDDFAGQSYTVTRQQAKDVQIRDSLVHRNGQTLTDGEVTQSHQYGAKPSNWYLAVTDYGGRPIPANNYINIEHNPIVNVVFTHP